MNLLQQPVVQGVLFVIAGVAAFILSWIAARAVRDFVGGWLVRHHAQGDVVVLGRRAVYASLLLVGAFIALGLAFRSQNVTIAGVVIATVVASLGVQDVLKNYVSGFYVLLERNIHVGDRIEFQGESGVIEDIRLRVSLLRGDDGSTIVVPNAQLFNNVVAVRAPSRSTRAARSSRKRAQDDPAEGVEPV